MGMIKTIERSGKRGLMRVLGAFLHAPRHTSDEVRAMSFDKILVIRQHHQMGDMLLAVPALRAIKERYPGARLDVVSSTLNRDVMRICPYVDRVFTYDKRNLAGHLRLVSALRSERYALAIVMHTVSFSFTTLALAVLSGARVRIGSTSPAVGDRLTGSYLSLTLPLPSEQELATMNEAEHNLYPLRAVGITTDNLAPEIAPGGESERWAEGTAQRCWPAGNVKLAVHPGAGKSENIWPAERFAAVVGRLASRKGVSVAVVEGPRDRGTVEEFVRGCGGVTVEVIRGRSIGDVAALLRRADLVLCNDTGVMHVAAAAGATTLAVFGPTDPARWAPRSERLSIVRAPGGRLADLSIDPVAERVLQILGLVTTAEGYVER
jgi:ADP-heptose:LPS heptosyltransferase